MEWALFCSFWLGVVRVDPFSPFACSHSAQNICLFLWNPPFVLSELDILISKSVIYWGHTWSHDDLVFFSYTWKDLIALQGDILCRGGYRGIGRWHFSTLSEAVSSFGEGGLKNLMLPNVLAKFQNSVTAQQREADEINISEWKTDRNEKDGNLLPKVWENRRPIGEFMPEGCRSVQFIRFPQKEDYCFWICKLPSLKGMAEH